MVDLDRQSPVSTDEFGTDVLMVFVGHAEDAVDQSRAIKGLEGEFQRLLDQRLEVMRERPFSRVKVWEWKEDAKATPMGQRGLIAPYLDRAQLAIFVFRQRMGEVTWQELERFCKRADARPVMALFPQELPIAMSAYEEDVLEDWLFLVKRKRELTGGWTDPSAHPVRPLENYKDLEDLQRIVLDQFNRDLGSVLKASQAEAVQPQVKPVRALRPPPFAGYMERVALSTEIHASAQAAPIIAVEGLPLSGKSTAVALYLRSAGFSTLFKSAFWHDAQRADTLQDLLAPFENEFSALRLTGKAPATQCRQILAFLSDQNAVLVIDGFQFAESSAFEPLFRAAVQEGTPARLIVISRERIRSEEALTGIRHVSCGGFDSGDIDRYLSGLGGTPLGEGLARELLQKTEGLPIAIAIFCRLVKSGERDSRELLRGSQEIYERLGTWFDSIVSALPGDDYRLLQGLSVIGEPFGLPLSAAVAASLGLAGGAAVIRRLEQSFLIQRQDVDFWKVHQFVADFAVAALEAQARSTLHEAIALHHRADIELGFNRELTDEEFFALERSCRHYQQAGNASQASAVARTMSRTAKDRGFYQKLKRLCEKQLELDEHRVTWCTYDYSHCCFITGDIAQARRVLDALLGGLLTVDTNLRVQLARLYAEVSCASGHPDRGLEALSSIVASVDVTELHDTVRFQLRSCELELLTQLERYDDAEKLCDLYLADARTNNNPRNLAIGLTRKGVLDYRRQRYESARDNLVEGSTLFGEIKGSRGEPRDRRGLAWALMYLSPCLLECGEFERANSTLLEAIRIRGEIDESSSETRQFLKSLARRVYPSNVQAQITAEIGRLNERLGVSARDDVRASVELRLPDPCLLVLVGASGAGKTAFAQRHFKPSEAVSSDDCRELVCDDPNDQTVTSDAFELLNTIATKRLTHGRLTVIDATSVQATHRASLIQLARAHQFRAIAIVLDLPEEVCLRRNQARNRVVATEVVRTQIASLHSSLAGLSSEGFDRVHVFKSPEAIDAVSVVRESSAPVSSP